MENICSRCAKKGSCCCDSGWTTIFITLEDAMRIAKYTRENVDDIAIFRKIPKNHREYSPDDVYTKGIKYEHLMIRNRGKCRYLGEKGCKIFPVRPILCRLFPFWFEVKKGKISIYQCIADKAEDEDCLILKENFGKSDDEILKFMGEDKKELVELTKKYVEEIERHKKYAHYLKEGKKLSWVIEKFGIKI